MQAIYFQIYLTSILHTYKVSRKLQNIYYYQEGIIMLRSKDKTICRTQKHSRASFSLLCSNTLPSWIRKDITHLYQEKLRYRILYKAPFYKKTSLHTKPKCVYDNYM